MLNHTVWDVAQKYADCAKSALIKVPDSEAKNALIDLADYVVSRDS